MLNLNNKSILTTKNYVQRAASCSFIFFFLLQVSWLLELSALLKDKDRIPASGSRVCSCLCAVCIKLAVKQTLATRISVEVLM